MGKEKSKRVKPRLLKGMQDGWPELAAARRAAMAAVEEVFRSYGFLPFDTPALEAAATLFGRDPDPEQLTGNFVFEDNDDELVALRYEHTAPLARVVSQYRNELALPFRRYTMGPVWRFDKPEPGRYREFLQLDVDIVGAPGMAADAEIMAVICAMLEALGVDRYILRFSNRKLLSALGGLVGATPEQGRDIYRVIDKLDKFSRERVRLELGPGLVDQSGDPIRGLGLDDTQIASIDEFLDLPNAEDNEATLAAAREWFGANELAQEALDELAQLLRYLRAFGVKEQAARLDLHLARGLGYYTGPVFEVMLPDLPEFGSMFGGGRYDGLVERFLGAGQGIPAVGASVGLDRLLAAQDALRERRREVPNTQVGSSVLVTVMDKARMVEYIALTCALRAAGIPAEVFQGSGNLGKQLKYADKQGIPLAVIAGEDEFARGEVSVKDLELGRRIAAEAEAREEWTEQKQQTTLSSDEVVEWVKQRLGGG